MLSMLPLLPLLLLPPRSWVLSAHHVATRLHATTKLQEVTPRGPKRVEIEISLL